MLPAVYTSSFFAPIRVRRRSAKRAASNGFLNVSLMLERSKLPVERSFRTSTAASGFEAGIQAESFHPDCIVVDFSIGQLEALQICQNLRRSGDFAETILIALLPDDGGTASFDRSSINETFKKPFDAALLAERLRTLVGAKKELV